MPTPSYSYGLWPLVDNNAFIVLHGWSDCYDVAYLHALYYSYIPEQQIHTLLANHYVFSALAHCSLFRLLIFAIRQQGHCRMVYDMYSYMLLNPNG